MMARYVDHHAKGPIIELGPGTGPVTTALLQKGIAPERLILVEFDPHFCTLLARRFPKCRIVQGDAYNLHATLRDVLDEPACAVVSSLPLLTRPDADRFELLRQSFDLMQPHGRFIQFTYGMVSPIPRRPRDELDFTFAAEASPAVWLNLPPARVWVYRRSDAPACRETPAPLIMKIKQRTGKVREDLLETADRFEDQIRQSTMRARHKIELQRLRMSNDPALRPALNLLRRIGEKKPRS
jgi:phosphatidylethanolamine/phosphatidyl-N-methylethanolamine N-methyltransferase